MDNTEKHNNRTNLITKISQVISKHNIQIYKDRQIASIQKVPVVKSDAWSHKINTELEHIWTMYHLQQQQYLKCT